MQGGSRVIRNLRNTNKIQAKNSCVGIVTHVLVNIWKVWI